MINIIKNGKSKFKTTCERCLCVFEYDLSDLFKMISCEYVRCPHCKNDVLHYPSKEDNENPTVVANPDTPTKTDFKYLTAEQVRNMSRKEVRENYSNIMKSMKKW